MKPWITGGRGKAAPISAPTSAPAPAPRGEVIPAPAPLAPARPERVARPLTLPAVRIPGNLGQWGMLAVYAFLFKISADATEVTVVALFPGATWTTAALVQAALSMIERFHFAGNRNPFTWAAFFADTLMVAAGLALALIPRFFDTPVWGMLTSTTGIGYSGIDGLPLLGAALLIGAFVAYSGDKALDLAMGR